MLYFDIWHLIRALVLRLPNVELELPSAVVTLGNTPELQGADFGDPALQPDRDDRAAVRAIGCRQTCFERGYLLDIATPVFHFFTHAILFAGRRGQEVKDGLIAHHQTELFFTDVGFRPFFHPERHDTQCIHRGRNAGNGRHGALDADVIAPRRT